MKTKIFAVTGCPVIHSKSPELFNNAFRKTGIASAYVRLSARDARQAISVCKSLGINGLNVTAPFKESIVEYLDKIHGAAKVIGCVNTIVNKNGKLHGYNTDYYGVTQSFAGAGIDVKGRRCLIIGAGGAGKAAAYGMHNSGAKVDIITRTYSRAKKAAKIIGCETTMFGELEEHVKKADIIISSLSQKINPVKKEWLSSSQIIFDANYKGSGLIAMAREKGCTIVSAENWLLNQAVMAYELFLGVKPNKEFMKQGLALNNLAKRKNTISLIGLAGAGKTSLGKIIAKKMGYNFKDIDDEIETKQQKTIKQIFENHGEDYFRNLETEALAGSINSKKPLILSCGGGIVLSEQNRKTLKENSLVAWLYASPEEIIQRIDLSKRPLLCVNDPLEKLKELFNSRKDMYAGTADIIFSTEGKIHKQSADRIIKELETI